MRYSLDASRSYFPATRPLAAVTALPLAMPLGRAMLRPQLNRLAGGKCGGTWLPRPCAGVLAPTPTLASARNRRTDRPACAAAARRRLSIRQLVAPAGAVCYYCTVPLFSQAETGPFRVFAAVFATLAGRSAAAARLSGAAVRRLRALAVLATRVLFASAAPFRLPPSPASACGPSVRQGGSRAAGGEQRATVPDLVPVGSLPAVACLAHAPQGWRYNRRCAGALDARASDEQLVLACKRGDARAFAALFARYQTPLFNYIRRLVGTREAAEDLTQEAFYRAFLNLGRTTPDTHFRAWLYRIATNLGLSHLRARRPQVSLDDDEPPKLPARDGRGDPEASQLRRETAELVHHVLRRMQESHRQVLLLRDHHGLSYQEIAEVMGLSIEAVTSLLHRARQDFRARYSSAVAAGAPGGQP